MISLFNIIIAALLFAVPTPDHAASHRGNSCQGGLQVNTSANGYAGHGSQISAVYRILVLSRQLTWPIAWEYQTYGGSEYFQLAGIVSYPPSKDRVTFTGPASIVPFHGSVWQAVHENAKLYHWKALPVPLNWITPDDRLIRKVECSPQF